MGLAQEAGGVKEKRNTKVSLFFPHPFLSPAPVIHRVCSPRGGNLKTADKSDRFVLAQMAPFSGVILSQNSLTTNNSSILNLRLFTNAILVRTAKCKTITHEVLISQKYTEETGPDEKKITLSVSRF